MKHLSTIALIMLFICASISAQEPKSNDKVLKDTVIKTVTYKIYLGSRGGRYILRLPASGKVYKQYLK